MFDLYVRNGVAVCPGGLIKVDVAVSGGRIAALLDPGLRGVQAEKVIDADGLYVLPGGIDPHVHIGTRLAGSMSGGCKLASTAAAFGGTTTFIHHADPRTGGVLSDGIRDAVEMAVSASAVDYSFHCVVPPMSSISLVAEMGPVLEIGVTSFKAFMLTSKSRAGIDEGLLYGLMTKAAELGATVVVHAESGPLNDYHAAFLGRDGKTGIRYFSKARPNISEEEAIRKALFLASSTGANLYINHVSTAGGVAAIREARQRGQSVQAETCPHYLFFNDSVYEDERDILFNRAPPIKSEADRQALWRGLVDGTLSVVSTDDVPSSLADKLKAGRNTHPEKLPGGLCQLETRLCTLYSAAVPTGVLTLEHLTDALSTMPAKIFGLYPRKGAIAIGSDADLVLFDPRREWTIRAEELHSGSDYTIYEGMRIRGKVAATILRGKIIVEGDAYLGSAGDGIYLSRELPKRTVPGGDIPPPFSLHEVAKAMSHEEDT
jgi:dihydropyrimidinase